MRSREILRWGLDKSTKEFRNILNVSNGISCNCICPVCKTTLIARQGEKNTQHFQHDSINKCTGAAETALHLKAKDIIAQHKVLKLPELIATVESGSISESVTVVLPKRYDLDSKVLIEKVDGNITPDLVVSYKGSQLLVEIAVTHFVDKKKRNKIIDKDISCIEIDLSELYKSKENITDSFLFEHVIERTDNKKWIYNKKYTHAIKIANNNLLIKKKYEKEKEKQERNKKKLQIRRKVTQLLGKNHSILINLEDSEYYKSSSNIVSFELHGKLNATASFLESRYSLGSFTFQVSINIDSDFNSLEFNYLLVEDVTIKMKYLEDIIERELRKLSGGNLYSWLAQNTTKLSRY